MKPNNDELEQWYQQSQRSHPAPQRIFRKVVAHLHSEHSALTIYRMYKQWLPLLSAAMITFFVGGLYWFHNYTDTEFHDSDALIAVELHGFAEPPQQGANYALERQHYWQDYLAKEQSRQIAATKLATIELATDAWELRDCNNTLIKLSDQLITMLRQESRIELDVNIGTQVEIALNDNGLILFISRKNAAMC